MIRGFWHDGAKKNFQRHNKFPPPQEICELALLKENVICGRFGSRAGGVASMRHIRGFSRSFSEKCTKTLPSWQ